jgi:hypothetical protein
VTFEHSANGLAWTSLGNGTRISGGWQLTGVSLPFNQNHYVRARGYGVGGNQNASGSLFESVRTFYLRPAAPIVDFDGDGKTDIAIYRKNNGTWWIIPSSGGSPISVSWGGDSSDIPVVGDWNGTGITKIGVFRKSTGTWYLDLNGNRLWDGCETDACLGWGGDSNDIPLS